MGTVVIQWLVDNGVDQKQREKDQMTALHWAAKRCHELVIKLTIRGGEADSRMGGIQEA